MQLPSMLNDDYVLDSVGTYMSSGVIHIPHNINYFTVKKSAIIQNAVPLSLISRTTYINTIIMKIKIKSFLKIIFSFFYIFRKYLYYFTSRQCYRRSNETCQM